MAELKEGDIVQLNSGGPKMTVKFTENRYGTPDAACQWFDEKSQKHEERFPISSLKKLTD